VAPTCDAEGLDTSTRESKATAGATEVRPNV